MARPHGNRWGRDKVEERAAIRKDSLVAGVYEKTGDRESADEKLTGRVAGSGTTPADAEPTHTSGSTPQQPAPAGSTGGGFFGTIKDIFVGTTGPRGGVHDGLIQTAARSAVRTIGTQVGKEILRGVLGGLMGGKRR